MSDPITPGSSPPAGASDPPSAPTPLDESAGQFMAAITGATKLIPGFEPEHPETARFVRRYRGFSRDAITMAINAVEENPELEGANTFNLERARAAIQYQSAYPPAVNMVNTLGRDLQFTLDYQTALALQDSLQIYAVAKAFGRAPSGAKAAAHASNIKRVLRRPRTRKKVSTPATPTPAPVPPKQ
jgi:hypothetical protein